MTVPTPRQMAPELDISTLDGAWRLSEQQPVHFTLIVVYRGLHCPICKASLRELDQELAAFAERGVDVIAMSGDSEDRARQSKAQWGINNVRIGYDLTEQTARAWGLFVSRGINDKEPSIFFEPGLFLVKPDVTLYSASIQSMPFARPAIGDLMKAIDFIVEKDYPARGEA
ncbi:MAG: redoxin domain-containing protein [Bryobacteraceae bacterium]|nr:redoxin domain-containing protein [Bryobacteraceae bacterium]